jgi:hypothetical protein
LVEQEICRLRRLLPQQFHHELKVYAANQRIAKLLTFLP